MSLVPKYDTRRISVPLSTTTPPMYSPADVFPRRCIPPPMYSAQGPPHWHRNRSCSFPDPTYQIHPAAAATVAPTASPTMTRPRSPLNANPQWLPQPQQSQQQPFGASPPASAQSQSSLPPALALTDQTQTQAQQSQFRLPHLLSDRSRFPATLLRPPRARARPPKTEPQSHLQSTSMIPPIYNAGYPYYAQPTTAPPAPARTCYRPSDFSAYCTSTPAHQSLNTDAAAPFNTGLPSSATLSSAIPSTALAPSSLSPRHLSPLHLFAAFCRRGR